MVRLNNKLSFYIEELSLDSFNFVEYLKVFFYFFKNIMIDNKI